MAIVSHTTVQGVEPTVLLNNGTIRPSITTLTQVRPHGHANGHARERRGRCHAVMQRAPPLHKQHIYAYSKRRRTEHGPHVTYYDSALGIL
ncbi:hypothetical protein OPQ81_003063 [Rhizoctonia solani]|nr:hypothetical protein OPQ81_003063 [Rhizoctonia solani]